MILEAQQIANKIEKKKNYTQAHHTKVQKNKENLKRNYRKKIIFKRARAETSAKFSAVIMETNSGLIYSMC